MPLYLVCAPPPNSESSPADKTTGAPRDSSAIGKNLEDSSRIKNHFKVWDTAYFVSAKLSVNEVANELGIHPEGLGLVVPLEMGSISGRASSNAVQWLQARVSKPSSSE